MTGDGLATTYQWTLATLCRFLHKHEAGPDGGGRGRRDSRHSMGWAERMSNARISFIAFARPWHQCRHPYIETTDDAGGHHSRCKAPSNARSWVSGSPMGMGCARHTLPHHGRHCMKTQLRLPPCYDAVRRSGHTVEVRGSVGG